MKFAKLAILATAIAATPIAANAQDAGTTVYGNDDAPIGTVESNDGTTVLVDTGKHKAPLPANLLGERPLASSGETVWSVNATQAQINGMMDAQVAQANAARDAALVEGAAVVSADGIAVGSIYTVDDADTAIIQTETGIMTLTRESFAATPEGGLMALYSAEQITANTVAVPEGAEILTPAQAAAKEAEMAAGAEGDSTTGAAQ